jgi:hypothetical protein
MAINYRKLVNRYTPNTVIINKQFQPTNHIRDLYRDINEVKKGYQSKTNLVIDEHGELLNVNRVNMVGRYKYSQLSH